MSQTITTTSHGFTKNQKIIVSGCEFSDFNGEYLLTSADGNVLTLTKDLQIGFWLKFYLFVIGTGFSIIYMESIFEYLFNFFNKIFG